MKANKNKETNKKFSFGKMEIAKLKNMHLVVGGGGDEPYTFTDTSKKCLDDSSAKCA